MAMATPLFIFFPAIFAHLASYHRCVADYVLYSGEVLTAGQNLTNGQHQLSMRPDCDLELTDSGKLKWRANITGKGDDCYLGFKHNGELVVRRNVHYTLWSTGNKSKKGRYALVLHDNGKIAIYGQRRWASNNHKDWSGHGNGSLVTTEYVLRSGRRLNMGKQLTYRNFVFGLSDCNLVINDTTSGQILWQTNTKASRCYVQLEGNGELTLKRSKQRLWSSNKRSDNGAYVGVLRFDGRFAIYGPLLWSNDPRDSVKLPASDPADAPMRSTI